MIHLFKGPDGTVFIVDICDPGDINSPIKVTMGDSDSMVTLDSWGTGWYMVMAVLEMIEGCQEKLENHSPIVDLISSIHYACVSEPDNMGVI